MPEAVKYFPPGDVNRPGNDFVASERDDRKLMLETARKYYDATNEPILDMKDGEPDDNVIINVFKQAVDRTASMLFPQVPDFELDPDATDQTPDEKWLLDVWEANGGLELMQEMAQTGCFMGHNFVRVTAPDRDAGDEFPRIMLVNPGNVVAYWRVDDIKRVLWYEISWTSTEYDQRGARFQVDYILDVVNNGKQWQELQYKREGSATWVPDGSQKWMWKFGPVVDWKHLPNQGHYYGKGETDNLELSDKINEKSSETNRIIRYHSAPKTVGTGVEAGEINRVGADELWTVGSPDAEFYNLEMKSDLAAAKNHTLFMYDNFLAERRVVILKGEIKDFQRVTNAGVRTVFMDALNKNKILQASYGKALAEISRRLFILKDGRTDVVPTVNMRDALPTDRLEDINVASVERSLNIVSRETLAKERGRDWPTEVKHLKNEANNPIFNPVGASPAPDTNGTQSINLTNSN